ncbi:MAG: sulfite exporter TauE/SafE family protein [Pseudomonadota bacterium]
MDWLYPLSGFLVGLIVGVTGVGGGSLMTPLLVLLFGIQPAVAVGTDLLYAAFTKSVGVVAHSRQGNIDWKTLKLLAIGSLPATLITTWVLHTLNIDATRTAVLIKSTLGVALLLTAAAIILRTRIIRFSRESGWIKPHQVAPATIFVGAFLGAMVTISSVGAGAVGVAALFFLYPNMPVLRIVGTDIAHAVPLTLLAGLGHASLGTVDYTLLGNLLIGSVPGIWIGSQLSSRLPERWLRGSLATLLVLIGGKLVF